MSAPPVPPRAIPPRLDSFEAAFQVAQLTVRRSVVGWRSFIALLVAATPAGLGLLVNAGGAPAQKQESFFYAMLSHWHFGIAVPVVAMVFATAFPWPEAEEGTLTYWFTSPVRRFTVLLGRYAAALFLGAIVLSLGVLAIALPLETRPVAETARVARTAVAATLLAYPAYLAVFQLVATVFRRGLAFGVVFVMFENFISVIAVTSVARLTLVFYVRSQMHHAVPSVSRATADTYLHVSEPASALVSGITFASVAALALGLSLWLVEVIEYRGRTTQAS